MDDAVRRVLGLLKGVRPSGQDQWVALCPSHEDHKTSLSIGIGTDSRVLLNCFVGCPVEKVVGTLGLELSDLFVKANGTQRIAWYGVRDESGQTVAWHKRIQDPDGGKRFQWFHPDGRPSKKGEISSRSVPLYGTEKLKERSEDRVVVVEGEKACDALTRVGVLAVATVTGADVTPDRDIFRCLEGREVLLWPDADPQGLGQHHMETVANLLSGLDVRSWMIDWAEAPPKGDAFDFIALHAENAPTALDALFGRARATSLSNRLGISTAAELQHRQLAPPVWIIPDLVPAGLTILAGRPKMGKSWLVLGVGLAVACGGMALGKIPVDAAGVLYLSLEDNDRRLKDRIGKLQCGEPYPDRLAYATEWPRFGEGAGEHLDEWLREKPDVKLVIIDTLQKIRRKQKANSNVYQEDYDAVVEMKAVADRRGVAVVLVHHTRKAVADDVMDEISGSTGITGGADNLWVLKRARGESDALLFVTGRDIEEQELAVRMDPETSCWMVLGTAADYLMTRQRTAILRVLKEGGKALTPVEIAKELEEKPGNVRRLVYKMKADGQIVEGGDHRYTLPDPEGQKGDPFYDYPR